MFARKGMNPLKFRGQGKRKWRLLEDERLAMNVEFF
jgi:hypothetical protein